MMIGYFDIAVPTEKGSPEDPRISKILDRLDKNKDGRLDREEIPERLRKQFSKVDRDGDDAVTREELAAGFAGE